MNCLHVHDFISGTTITLPRVSSSASDKGRTPNIVAAALVADHLARICALHKMRRPARRAA
jgi:hypothetical protein